MIELAVCVQIRNGSTRLPGKGSMKLENIPVFQRMLSNVGKCVDFINLHSQKKNIRARLYFLVPFDEHVFWLKSTRDLQRSVEIVVGKKGDNSNVFHRFNVLFKNMKPNYMVRLTGDCPFLPSALVNKAVNIAVNHRIDYVSNVDERFRTMPDGFDVEVISDEAFSWLAEQKLSDSHREHVTTYIREHTPKWMRVAMITSVFDTSDHKYSLDTQEDFENLSRRFSSKIKKDMAAKRAGLGIYEF